MVKDEMMIVIIYLEDRVLLSKKHYESWQQIRGEYKTYKASLGPYSLMDVVAFFEGDFGSDDLAWPFSRQQIDEFVRSSQEVIESK